MKPKFTKMKLISITCEHSVEKRILNLLAQNGVRSVRVADCRIEEFNGHVSVDLNGSQSKIECIVSAQALDAIVFELAKCFLPKFDLGFFVSDAEVMRPEIFCSTTLNAT